MNYNLMSIMMHRACNAECDMCCTESNPRCTEKLDIDKVKNHIKSSENIKSIEEISITGGEAFLNYPMLLEIIECISQTGKRATIMTNGFWANDYKVAYNKLKKLKEKGLYSIGTSCDYFHLKYIPIENLKNLLHASVELSIPVGINLIYEKDKSMGALINELQEYLHDVTLLPFQWQSVGKAKGNLDQRYLEKYKVPKPLYCTNSNIYNIRYDGKVYPCCSPYIFNTALDIGNYEDVTCEEVLYKLYNNRLLHMLHKYGFHYFIGIIEKNNIDIAIPTYIESTCELCAKLFTEKNVWKLYPYIYKDMECKEL